MKTQKILNIITFVLAVIGLVFKQLHWPGASVILLVAYLVLFYLLFRYGLVDNKEAGISQLLNYLLILTLAVFIFTLLFKSMHWPGAQILSIASTLLVLVATGAFVFSGEGSKVSKQFVLVLFMFILLLDGLLQRTGWSKLPAIKGSEQEIAVAIAPTKMNVLYFGIDNPLEIVASGTENKNLEVKTDNGTVKGENGHYIANPQHSDMPATIKVYLDGKAIDSVVFRIKRVPEPTATVAGMSSGSISKELLINQKGVVAILPDFVFDLEFKVTEFTLVTSDGKFSMETVSKSDQFTQEQLDFLSKVKIDDRITIEDIKAKGPDGQILELQPLVFKLK